MVADTPTSGPSTGGRFPRILFLLLVAANSALFVWLSLASRDMTWPPPLAEIPLALESAHKQTDDRLAAERAELLRQREREEARREMERAAQREKERAAAEAERIRLRKERLALLRKENEAEKARLEAQRAAQQAKRTRPDIEQIPESAHTPDASAPPLQQEAETVPAAEAPRIVRVSPPRARLAKKSARRPARTAPVDAQPSRIAESSQPEPAAQERKFPGPEPQPEPESAPQVAGPAAKPAQNPMSQAASEPAENAKLAEGPPKALGPPPERTAASKIAPTPPPRFQLAEISRGAPLEPAPDPTLIEKTEFGPLPIIGKDGKKPWNAYARPFDGDSAKPRVAIMIDGLGLNGDLTRAAIERLPPEVTLAFVPYSEKLEMWTKLARSAGHEVLLNIPMEPQNYPAVDPGPKALLTSLGPKENRERLLWSLSRVSGYIGVADYLGSRFTLSRLDMLRLFRELKKRGLIFVDTRSGARSAAAEVAADVGIPWVASSLRLDSDADTASIDRDLEQLERFAREDGRAMGVASALPVTFDRIARWIKTLDKKGLALAPTSAIVKTVDKE